MFPNKMGFNFCFPTKLLADYFANCSVTKNTKKFPVLQKVFRASYLPIPVSGLGSDISSFLDPLCEACATGCPLL